MPLKLFDWVRCRVMFFPNQTFDFPFSCNAFSRAGLSTRGMNIDTPTVKLSWFSCHYLGCQLLVVFVKVVFWKSWQRQKKFSVKALIKIFYCNCEHVRIADFQLCSDFRGSYSLLSGYLYLGHLGSFIFSTAHLFFKKIFAVFARLN